MIFHIILTGIVALLFTNGERNLPENKVVQGEFPVTLRMEDCVLKGVLKVSLNYVPHEVRTYKIHGTKYLLVSTITFKGKDLGWKDVIPMSSQDITSYVKFTLSWDIPNGSGGALQKNLTISGGAGGHFAGEEIVSGKDAPPISNLKLVSAELMKNSLRYQERFVEP